MEVLYNVLVFIPAGFFFSALGKRKVASGIIIGAILEAIFIILMIMLSILNK